MAYDDRALRGVGGWLAFFVLTLAVFSPLRQLLAILALLNATPVSGMADRLRFFQTVGVIESVLGASIGLYLAWRLVRVQTPATPRIVIAGLWLGTLLLAPVSMAVLSIGTGLSIAALLAPNAVGLGQALAYNTIWTLYLLNSRRVANTYADEPADELHAVFE